MNNFSPFKNRVNNSGQGLAELSVFGALLLMVFGFLLRYGMQYNYQQQVKMEAFRRALEIAYESDASKSHEVVLVKDVHVPNPQDMFVQGDRQTIRETTSMLWSNSSRQMNYTDANSSSTVKYIFNPDKKFSGSGSSYTEIIGAKPAKNDVVVKEFTTAALTPPMNPILLTQDYLILKGVNSPYRVYSMDDTKVYLQEEGYGEKEVMVLMKDNPAVNCDNTYCPKAIVGEAHFGRAAPFASGFRYYPVHSVNGDKGEIPTSIVFLDSEAGQINTTYAKQQTENKDNLRHNRLVLDENSAQRESRDILSETENVTHVIITRDGERSPSFAFKNEMSKPWTTPK
jgi:hypothetical protein